MLARIYESPVLWSTTALAISIYTFTLHQALSLLCSSVRAPLAHPHQGSFALCQNRFSSSPWWAQMHLFFSFGFRHHSCRPLLHKHVDKRSIVNFGAGDIYSVTKQLLELAPWACFPFRQVISCLHASGPWATSPPMTEAPWRNWFIIATKERFPKSIFCFNEVYWHW